MNRQILFFKALKFIQRNEFRFFSRYELPDANRFISSRIRISAPDTSSRLKRLIHRLGKNKIRSKNEK